ncbi:hypothetical protein ABI59_05140 [Acidobacteria bacterium Mor1]|nr:hypothetical protein ABI59_05140 [Acidobacteria bacterium Mor1]
MKPSRSHRARDPRASRFLTTLAEALAPEPATLGSGSRGPADAVARLVPVLDAAGADPQQLGALLEAVEEVLDDLASERDSAPAVSPPPLPRPCDPHFFG